jgi:hypothetical protein
MVGGIASKFGSVGNVDSVSWRQITAREGTNPTSPLSTFVSDSFGGLHLRIRRFTHILSYIFSGLLTPALLTPQRQRSRATKSTVQGLVQGLSRSPHIFGRSTGHR